jgi:SAM-dependent methyltransferase
MQTNTEVKFSKFKDIIDVLMHTKNPRLVIRKNKVHQSKYCFACGHSDGFVFLNIINDDLADQWKLATSLRKSFDIRESTKCRHCGSSFRSNLHARTICKVLAPNQKCLAQAINHKPFSKLKIAEINASGALHKVLVNHPNLQYSEYRPEDKTIRHENLDKLSYTDASFDLVLTSETLEHVPDWQLAMSEIQRVLKPGGYHIFTVPAILTRRTRVRAVRERGKITKYLPASHHGYNRGTTSDYLVFNEFGADYRKAIDELGFDTKIYYRNVLRLSDPNFIFVSTKV